MTEKITSSSMMQLILSFIYMVTFHSVWYATAKATKMIILH